MNVAKTTETFRFFSRDFDKSLVLRTFRKKTKNFQFSNMCGSLLSKFAGRGNQVAPVDESAFRKPKRVQGKTNLAEETTSICETSPVDKSSRSDLGVKEKPNEASARNSEEVFEAESSENSEEQGIQETSPGNEKDAEARAMDSAAAILSAQRALGSSDKKIRAMQSAKEILEAQIDSGPSSSTTIASQPVSSTRSVLMGATSNAIAFEVLVGQRPTARPLTRVPRRLSKLESQPRASTKQVNAKLLAAEERKLRELENIRARASSRAGGDRPHPAEAASKATAQKIASKQAVAERNRNDMIASKKQSGSKSSRKRNKIAAAQASAKEELQSAIGQKMEKAAQRKAAKKQQRENQKNLRAERTKRVKENVSTYFLDV